MKRGRFILLKRMACLTFVLLIISPCILAQAQSQVQVLVGDVKETRRTDGFFNKLEVQLKVMGEIVPDVRGVRVALERAIDSTGRNLIDEKKMSSRGSGFDDVSASDSENFKIDLEMKNAARRATVVTEIAGVLELFVPGRDPGSTVIVSDFNHQTGKSIANASLRTANVDLLVWNKQQYEGQKKAEEEKIKKQIEEKKKSGTPEEQADIAEALASGLMKVFGGLFNAMTEMSENGIALKLTDPQKRVINVEFTDESGKPISSQGRTSMGDDPRTMIFDFEQKLPENAKLKVYLLTTGSVVKAPFKVTNVPLP